MNELVSLFRQHGTKIIGYVTAAIAVLSVADPVLVTSLLGERGRSWILLIAGILTALRGHTNTAAIKDEIRVEEVAKEEVKVSDAVDKIHADAGPKLPTETRL